MRIYTGGTFDLFHEGHVNFLSTCSSFGEVVVSLNTDEFIRDYKGSPPVCNFEERKAVLMSCKFVSEVVPNIGGADSTVAIERVMPNVVAIGSDWARKDYYSQMSFTQDWLDERMISLLYIPYSSGISSTAVKARIVAG